MEVYGLNEMTRDLDKGILKMPKEFSACLDKVSAIGLRKVKLKTPVAKSTPSHTGGTLRRGWRVVKRGSFETAIQNEVEYASYIENGHRTRSGSVVDGRYMLKTTTDELEEVLDTELGKVLDELF